MHEYHEHQQCQQVKREQCRSDVVCQQAEQRRHGQIAQIGACHLDADDRLRSVRAEVFRRGVDDAGIDGRTAQPYQNKTVQGKDLRPGQQQSQHPCGQNALTHADHLRIVEFQGQKAAGGAPGSDADVEQAGKAGGSAGGNALRQCEVAAGPQTGRGLQCTVAEEAQHHLSGTRQTEYLSKAQRLRRRSFGVGACSTALP